MIRLALAAVITAALTFKTHVFAQQPAPLAAATTPGPGPRPPAGGPAPHEQGLRPVTTFQGKVVKLKANNDFTFDGIYMLSGGDSLLVKFPALMGSQIMPVAKTGSQISVSGAMETSPFGMKEIKVVSLTAGDKTLTETSSGTVPAAVQETSLTGSGKVSALQTGHEGRVTGIFIDNNVTTLSTAHRIAAGNACHERCRHFLHGQPEKQSTGRSSIGRL